MFFYNVLHISLKLIQTKNEDRLVQQREEIKNLREQLLAYQNDPPPCNMPADSGSKSESKSEYKSDDSPSLNTPTIPITPTTPTTPLSLPTIPILVMSCNRADYLKTTLSNLFKYRPSENFPIIISQGCGDSAVANFLKDEYGNNVVALQHHRKEGVQPYFAIAQHYGWALSQIFSVMNYDSVIIVEDDLEISVDFFSYFIATYPILRSDPSLYCVSSWNDNGMGEVVRDPKAIYRTEVFPGLGWMMTKSLWSEIASQWPDRYWDEFMRLPNIRKDRACLFPEISRNRNIGKRGTSEEQFWDKISRIKFNEENVTFTEMDLSILKKDRYDADLKGAIEKAKLISWTEVDKHENADLRISYATQTEFKSVAQFFRIMDDEKEGMPRTSYKGIVKFHHNTNTVFLTPENIDSRW